MGLRPAPVGVPGFKSQPSHTDSNDSESRVCETQDLNERSRGSEGASGTFRHPETAPPSRTTALERRESDRLRVVQIPALTIGLETSHTVQQTYLKITRSYGLL